MNNETNAPKAENSTQARSMEQKEERSFKAVRECMAYQKSLKDPNALKAGWEIEVWKAAQKAQQEAQDTGKGV